MRQAISEGRRAYVLVNNRVEGNAPLTVEGLVGDVARLSRLEKECVDAFLWSLESPTDGSRIFSFGHDMLDSCEVMP